MRVTCVRAAQTCPRKRETVQRGGRAACRELRKYWQPPYRIGNGFGALGTRTVSMGATHHDGALQWDTHNLYGISEGIATASAVAAITRQRPFVLSRCAALTLLPRRSASRYD